VPGPRWPSGADHDRPGTNTDRPAIHATHTHARPAAPDEPVPDHAASAHQHSDPVRVRPGDSLWLLAAQRLGPHASDAQIAAEWPRWYAANRVVVGPDPDLIVPGQVLHVPAPHSQEAR
jgi:nucleoid-associated protein YgaU